MKKVLRIFLISVFFLLIIGVSKNVEANSISKISMDIYVDNNGDATINEVWTCATNTGTEVYHPYYNLGKSKIENLEVSENGRKYQTLSSWDTSGSLSTKAYKCGINKISNGVELCWGISNYGSHTYNVKYTISNFIANLSDSQMIYWNLIPQNFSNVIGNVHISIYTYFYIEDSTSVWGYGNYGGTAYINNGKIEMDSEGAINSNEYMTILAKFPSNTFSTNNKISHNFDYYYNMAEEGTEKYSQENTKKYNTIIRNIEWFAEIILFLCIIISPIYMMKTKNIKKLKLGKQEKLSKDVPYYRDIPCNKDIFRAYYIGYNYGLLKRKTDIVGSIILKWIKDSIIKIEKKKGIFGRQKIYINLNLNSVVSFSNIEESRLYNMLYEASKDGILENREFEKWCEKSCSKVLKWFNDILKKERDLLVKEKKIVLKTKKIFKFFTKEYYVPTPELKEEAMQLAGLKKFLNEYTLIKDRQPLEVNLFEEYLIYAQMMGIAKKVSSEFKEVYPKIIELTKFGSYDNIIIIHTYVRHHFFIIRTAAIETNLNRYSSGGGGRGAFGSGRGRRRI